jgi:LysM repeat protein
MKRNLWLLPLIVVGFVALFAVRTFQPAAAQTEDVCQIEVERAITAVADVCDSLGRNQVCYGNTSVEADARDNADLQFSTAGDVSALSDIERLITSPFTSDPPEWGIALVKAQVNLPDALPGQNVTFLLYGDAALDNPTADMRAVKLTTSLTEDVNCADAPASALLVQAPRGTQVTLTLNGADIILGSTAYITAEFPEMTIATLDGVVVASAFGFIRVIQPGEQVFLPLDEEGNVNGGPSEVEPYNCEDLVNAPLSLLPEPVELPACEGEPVPTATPANTATPRPGAPSATPRPVTTVVPCTVRTDWQYTYTVVRGDTLSNIGSRINVNAQVLAQGNCIPNANIIFVGQVLRVPAPVPPRPVITLTPSITATLTPSLTPTLTVTVPTVADSQAPSFVSVPGS